MRIARAPRAEHPGAGSGERLYVRSSAEEDPTDVIDFSGIVQRPDFSSGALSQPRKAVDC